MQDEIIQTANTPVGVQKRRGRPSFRPSADHRRTVAIMASNGVSQVGIARHFRLSVPTLCKYFRFELSPPATPAPSEPKGKVSLKKRMRR